MAKRNASRNAVRKEEQRFKVNVTDVEEERLEAEEDGRENAKT